MTGDCFAKSLRAPAGAVGRAAGPGEQGGRRPMAMADPDGKLAPAVAKRLGGTLVSAPLQAALGDTGSAAALLGAIQAVPVSKRRACSA